ncbi:hypothetical protein ES703_01483 [subsurface metagenome]
MPFFITPLYLPQQVHFLALQFGGGKTVTGDAFGLYQQCFQPPFNTIIPYRGSK